MKIWTIQNKNVVEMIDKNSIYFADFNKSRYLKMNENLHDLYNFLLNSFNSLNFQNLEGLIFAFATCSTDKIIEIENIQEFKDFLESNIEIIGGFIDKIDKSNSVIIELDLEIDFNPIFLDINDFQFLMPPIMLLPPFTNESIERIIENIKNGVCEFSEIPTRVFQAHIPYIKKSDVIAVHYFD